MAFYEVVSGSEDDGDDRRMLLFGGPSMAESFAPDGIAEGDTQLLEVTDPNELLNSSTFEKTVASKPLGNSALIGFTRSQFE